jgi:hypothetical protein
MLFSYPIVATANNWLHDSLCVMLASIHRASQERLGQLTWDDLVNATGRNELRRRTGLRDRMAAYQTVFRQLGPIEQARVQVALTQQNAIEGLLAGQCDCETITALPVPIREPLSDLFDFAFKLLSDLGVRDRMYQCIYDAIPEKVCPFCGCETFDSPQGPREALDHYLAESLYPCAAANLLNLVPMGNKCNSRYKLGVDIIRTPTGRRRAFFPYGLASAAISLFESVPFNGASDGVPQWRITFSPATEEVETWKQVFEIETRYIRDELDPRYYTFLREFRNWCRTAAPGVALPPTEDELINLLGRFAQNMELNGKADRAFLKAAVFRMLHQQCSNGHARLLAFIKDVVAGGTNAPA